MSNQQNLTQVLSDLYLNGIDTTNMTLEEAMEKWQEVVLQYQSEE
ncbi:hypothetical protein CrV_gp120 [Cylindrospermopsis raciborskii virus RM-2018a]|jgi:hypothetical protein|nr:hypothetical protein CrV_gp071 [Cylindrospermopsis raciborskii virus RM-2018a]AXK90530.1 hypothetical protein CrV_gp120 [Cylindrospermopsis raciborskii virus RM-2018a]WHL30640.1 hypothetical protein CrLKS4_g74 [Cylindrospermopsis phage Cr-LKS4]